MAWDVVTLGEALVRLTPPAMRRLTEVRAFEVDASGSEANTAVGLAGLGKSVLWLSRLTDNALGRGITRRLSGLGVDTSQVVWTEKDRVGLIFQEELAPPRTAHTLYDRTGSAMSRIRPAELPALIFAPDNARMLHLTGITPALSSAANNTALHALKRAVEAGWRVSFDVNYRPHLWSSDDARAGVEPFLRAADVAFISRTDVRAVYGLTDSLPAQRVLDTVAAYYPQAVWVLTLGRDGAIARERDGKIYKQDAFKCTDLSQTGCGGAFSAGFLAAYLDGATVADALKWGNAAAALKRATPGDLTLIDRTDIVRLLG
jgi:2-dehydro-3-deoxygluconokinase